MTSTIFAPATSLAKAGVAIVRISGSLALKAINNLSEIKNPQPRKAIFTKIKTHQGEPIDEALVIYFPSPNSFTGENVVELQLHGGRAIMSLVLEELSKIEGFRPAERGEFTRRAVENGKMDLTAAEGLADLIDAQTEQQRKQALRQMGGDLAEIYERWHENLLHILAWMEAYIDFPEEEIPPEVSDEVKEKIETLSKEINEHLLDSRRGEKLREGFQIVLIGAPNAGKSSLMNKLAQRDVAIVSSTAGTTRDIIEVQLDLQGYPVIISDTAGLRETSEEIELEGVKRAKERALNADLILWITDINTVLNKEEIKDLSDKKIFPIMNKVETLTQEKIHQKDKELLFDKEEKLFYLSVKTGKGIEPLINEITAYVEESISLKESPSLTRVRHRQALEESLSFLQNALQAPEIELMTEDLRMSMRSLGKITGQYQIDELLDVIFRDFCIGK